MGNWQPLAFWKKTLATDETWNKHGLTDVRLKPCFICVSSVANIRLVVAVELATIRIDSVLTPEGSVARRTC
jgi:hypothetical protein